MDKDSQAKLGRTSCDFCDRPATTAEGRLVVCAAHSAQAVKEGGVKQGAIRELPLKSAGLLTENLHNEG